MIFIIWNKIIFIIYIGIMGDLLLLNIDSGDIIRCHSFDDAREKAISASQVEGRIVLEFTPESGGLMTTLEFDRISNDWVSIS